MRHKISGFRKAELCGGPREPTQIPGGHLFGDKTQDGVVQLDDGPRVLGRKACSCPVLAVGVNPETELTTQTGLNELHQGLTREREGRRGTGQQPTHGLGQLETEG